jgi:hypothetical protein
VFNLDPEDCGGGHDRSLFRLIFALRIVPILGFVKGLPVNSALELAILGKPWCGRFACKSTQEVLAEWFDLYLDGGAADRRVGESEPPAVYQGLGASAW